MKSTQQTWWSSSERHHVYGRWCLLVLLNSAYPFILSLSMVNTPSHFIGICLAVMSFIVIYAEIDDWLLQQQYLTLSKQLKISASIKVATVVLPFIDIISGRIAIGITQFISGINMQHSRHELSVANTNYLDLQELVTTYTATMIDGLLLSLLVALILGLIRLIKNLRHTKKVK